MFYTSPSRLSLANITKTQTNVPLEMLDQLPGCHTVMLDLTITDSADRLPPGGALDGIRPWPHQFVAPAVTPAISGFP